MRILFIFALSIFSIGLRGQITIIVESLPNTTPKQDTIYIAGTFNNWRVNHIDYRLHPQLDGKYSITLNMDTGRIEFKFTRGSWQKVESGAANEYIPNRTFICSKNKVYSAEIKNWQDLGGVKQLNYVIFLLFAIAFYGIFLLYFALRIHLRTKSFSPTFFLFNTLIIIVLIGGVLFNLSNPIWQSHIGMIGIVFLYLWGPILHLYLESFKPDFSSRKFITHFFPAFIVLIIAILRFCNYKLLTIYAIELNTSLNWGNCVLISIGSLSLLIYHIVNYRILKRILFKKQARSKSENFINILYSISFVSWFLLVLIFMLKIFGISLDDFNGFEPVLVFISSTLFIEFYFHWKYPQIFHYKDELVQLFDNYKDNKFDKINYLLPSDKIVQKVSHISLSGDAVNELKDKLRIQMVDKKVFKDPKLNITILSEIIDTKPHILSKLLNEQFNKSFRDFINEYRIKEFIELSSQEKYKNYTLLALSFEVGFNSKSTFNLAFKKITSLSPREFLKNSKISLKE